MEEGVMSSLKRAVRGAAVLCAAISLAAATAPVFAQEDLPGRVGRIAEVAGELFIAPQDRPEAWTPAAINYPVASGDNLWAGRDARAEVDVGGTQLRLAGDTNLHVSRLEDREFALFVAQGRVSIRVRVLEGGEVARIDTPNAQVTITRPGLYRVDVSPDREHTYLVVREGEANVQTANTVQQVLPGQSAAADGPNPQYTTVQNGAGLDGFDAWVADRDRYYRTAASSYVSPQMVGAADLAQYGTWSQNSEYGAVWYPNNVPADWAPYRNGYWVDVGGWGPTWVDYAPWGYAPFHYGRWAYVSGRWGWTPGVYVARPVWAPALVAWTGGAGWSVAVRTGGPVYGWVPLAWGEPYRPWWGRCSYGCWERYNRPYAVNVNVWRPNSPPPTHYRNWNAPNGVTAVQASALYARQPVQQNLVRVSREQAATAPVLSSAPQVRADPGRAFQRPVDAPPPASSFQQSYARPSSAPPSGASMTRGTTMPVQPSSGNVSPATRTPTQAQPAMQRDDTRRAPSYAQPVPPAQSYAQPQGTTPSRAQPSPPHAQSPQREVQSPSQGQMTRSPQPVPGQPYPQAQPSSPSRVQAPPQPQSARVQPQSPQPQSQPQPARVQPQSPQPQAAPQSRDHRGTPPAQVQPAQSPQSRPAPDAGGSAQRGGDAKPRDAQQGQDSGGSGNMQRQGR